LRSSDDVIRQQIAFRYNSVKSRLAIVQARLQVRSRHRGGVGLALSCQRRGIGAVVSALSCGRSRVGAVVPALWLALHVKHRGQRRETAAKTSTGLPARTTNVPCLPPVCCAVSHLECPLHATPPRRVRAQDTTNLIKVKNPSLLLQLQQQRPGSGTLSAAPTAGAAGGAGLAGKGAASVMASGTRM
jgi:hypothetical protein